MRYLRNLSHRHKITLCFVVFFIGAALVILSFPFQTTLKNQEYQNLVNGLSINMPCARVELQPAEKTALTTIVNGKGLAFVRYAFIADEVRLNHIGLLRHVECTIKIDLAPNSEVRTPLNMPFIARNGVYPKNMN